MTDESIYSPSEYIKRVKVSLNKYLLVEGQDDKRCLMYLMEELLAERDDIEIHGAYQILSGVGEREKLGNREKVEEVCQLWSATTQVAIADLVHNG